MFLCRDGIEFVFQGFVQHSEKHSPPYLSYLTILSEFSSKLLKPDKKTMWVNQHCRERSSKMILANSKSVFCILSSDIAICSGTLASRASVTGRSAGCLSSITERLSREQLREKTLCPSSALTLINSSHSLISPDRLPSNWRHLKVQEVTKSILSQHFYYKHWHTTTLWSDFHKIQKNTKYFKQNYNFLLCL